MAKVRGIRAFTLVESLVAISVALAGVLVLLSVFTLGRRQADDNRIRLLAKHHAQSLLAEVLAHPYGTPEPEAWDEEVIPLVVVEGRQVQTRLRPSVEVAEDEGGNGSFFGESDEAYDVVRLRVDWKEGEEDFNITAVVTVRRENAGLGGSNAR